MNTTSKIKWETTLNPTLGQEKFKPGCKFNYVDELLERFRRTHGLPPTSVEPVAHYDFPDAEGNCGAVGDLGIYIAVRSLSHAQPSEIALVAETFMEVGRQLLDLLPPNPKHTNH
jgi:hypothetical protein